MTDAKIDTFRLSVFEKTFSDTETESETIDDFSQYSDSASNVIRERLSTDSRSMTPISKAVPIKISNNNKSIHVHDSLNSSMNEEKDISEDLMVQVSKKTTIKKIISKTTLVNGVTQASEFEEFTIHNNHLNENKSKLQDSKFNKDHIYSSFQEAMKDSNLHGNLLAKSYNENDLCVDEIIEATKVHKLLKESKMINRSSDNIEDSQTHKPSNEKELNSKNQTKMSSADKTSNDGTNQTKSVDLNEKEDDKINEHLIISETNNISLLTREDEIQTKNRISISKNDKDPNKETEAESIINISNSQNNKRRKSEQDLRIVKNNNDFHKNEIKNHKPSFINYKSQGSNKKDFKYNDTKDFISDKHQFILAKPREKENKNKYRNDNEDCDISKTRSLNPKTQFCDTNYTKLYLKTKEKPMKWVDPLKSYHLKYDLKDNGKSMQQWIKQKQDALQRSDPNNYNKNSINKKEIKCRPATLTKSYSKAPTTKKYNSQKDIKEFIIRGNIKENLFQIRHPYPKLTEREYIIYSPNNKRESEYSELNERTNFKYLSSQIPCNDKFKLKPQNFDFQEEPKSNLSFQVSKILDNFEAIEQDLQQKPNNDLKNCEECTYSHRNCCRRTGWCNICPFGAISCSCLLKKDKVVENYKYISYERLNDRIDEHSQFLEFDENTETELESCTNIKEKDINNHTRDRNKINYLETKLENIENRIHNIRSNSKRSTFECAIDLESQCREIENQLEYLYQAPRSIRESA